MDSYAGFNVIFILILQYFEELAVTIAFSNCKNRQKLIGSINTNKP